MDDKALARIDALLAQMQQSIVELRSALPILTATQAPPPAPKRSVGLLPYALRRQVRAATEQMFMSGRWRRRDGDVYGIVSQNDKQIDHADSSPRDIRSTDERGA